MLDQYWGTYDVEGGLWISLRVLFRVYRVHGEGSVLLEGSRNE